MKAALICLILTVFFVIACWYFVIPNLGLVLMMVPVTMIIVGAYDIRNAVHKHASQRAARHVPDQSLRMA